MPGFAKSGMGVTAIFTLHPSPVCCMNRYEPVRSTGLAFGYAMNSTTTPPAGVDPGVLDLTKALARLDGDLDFLKELFKLFLEDGPARGQSLARALETGDLTAATKAAHSLKGMSGTISAPKLMDLAYAMERAAKESDTAALAALHPRLAAMLEQVLTAIRTVIAAG
jgi:HPt (histidine-containing phosphotransfer) domain-containing protein